MSSNQRGGGAAAPPPERKKEEEMMLPQGGLDLLENCDLPPPLKHRHLLRALRLSQTRAREAEAAAAALAESNARLASLLAGESMRLYAHRQWLRLLEAEKTTWLRRQKTNNAAAPVADPPTTGGVLLALCLGIAGLGFVMGYRFLF
ncbi:unnamed protein product [Spirodela intermedia]|uniref:Uncharacterized protein n=1 Tax=Spirodela intermedia TaxID=51605 RepID=A0A7I8KCE0_SPIIN|nr:unnamed protein product [Spirodela intermedia]